MQKFATANLDQKITTFRRVIQVMEYLDATSAAMRDTKHDVEKELYVMLLHVQDLPANKSRSAKFDTLITNWAKDAENAKKNPFKDVNLEKAHDNFIQDMIAKANTKAKTAVKEMLNKIEEHKTKKAEEWDRLPAEVKTKFQGMITSKGTRVYLRKFSL